MALLLQKAFLNSRLLRLIKIEPTPTLLLAKLPWPTESECRHLNPSRVNVRVKLRHIGIDQRYLSKFTNFDNFWGTHSLSVKIHFLL